MDSAQQMLVRALGLHAGDVVNLDAEQGRLIVAPVTRCCYTLEQVLAMQELEQFS